MVDNQILDYENRKNELCWALRTRVLTNDELDKVRGYGYLLSVRSGETYNQEAKTKEFNDMLLRQFEMRVIAEKAGLRGQ